MREERVVVSPAGVTAAALPRDADFEHLEKAAEELVDQWDAEVLIDFATHKTNV